MPLVARLADREQRVWQAKGLLASMALHDGFLEEKLSEN
jgi:hypothetical protein